MIQWIAFRYPPVPVHVLNGPARLETGRTAPLRLSVAATRDVGPGLVRTGEDYWIYEGDEVIGTVAVRRVTPIGADPDDPTSWHQVRRSEIEVDTMGAGDVVCPACANAFSLSDRWQWTGVRHRPCGQKLRLRDVERQIEPVWCLIGNVIAERPYGPGGVEKRPGTKHFSPGTKLYCYPPLWGDGYEQVKVIGRHRGSPRLVTMIIRGEWIVNRRAKLVYEPAVVDRLSGYWDGTEESRALAESLAAILSNPRE